jgi:hypothetical protein
MEISFMKLVSLLFAFSLVLAACSFTPPAGSSTTQPGSSGDLTDEPVATATGAPVEPNPAPSQNPPPSGEARTATSGDLARIDEQGAVLVEVTPVNLTDPGDTLTFEVGLNTHSVDLSMDLVPLATLATDRGITVQASQWDAPRGGHHVSGKLVFPGSADGQPILEGVKTLTLTIKDLDVPERVFSWDLN